MNELKPVTYRITCGSCDLDHVMEAQDWRTTGLRIECCLCRTIGTIAMPENDARVTCKICGAITMVRKVDTEV